MCTPIERVQKLTRLVDCLVGQIIRREWRKVDEYASTSYLDSELAITPSALLENLLRAPINFIWGQRAFDQLARELEWFWS